MGTILKKTLTAAVAATTLVGGFAMATDASAQHRGGHTVYRSGGHYYGGYRGDRGWTAGSILAGAAIGAAIAGAPYYGGYYAPRYYGPRYYGPSYYGYYGPACVRDVWRWDPYIGRRVLVRTYC